MYINMYINLSTHNYVPQQNLLRSVTKCDRESAHILAHKYASTVHRLRPSPNIPNEVSLQYYRETQKNKYFSQTQRKLPFISPLFRASSLHYIWRETAMRRFMRR